MGTVSIFLGQFKSPIILLLLFAAILSAFLGDVADALIIMVIVLASGILGFWQEYGANSAVEKLIAMVSVKAEVLRDNKVIEVPFEDVVPVMLSYSTPAMASPETACCWSPMTYSWMKPC